VERGGTFRKEERYRGHPQIVHSLVSLDIRREGKEEEREKRQRRPAPGGGGSEKPH